MSDILNPKTDPGQPMVYQIRIEGHLGQQWTDWFEGLTITLEEDGNTFLTGPVVDQPALYGLLKKVRDLGVPLLSVNLIENARSNAPHIQEHNNVEQRRIKMSVNENVEKGSRPGETSPRKAALIAGFGLLVMFFAAIFANFFVIEGLIVAGDAETTVNNIMANQVLFRFGIVSFLIVLICDVLVAWALYGFFKPANADLSMLAAWLRLVYTAIFGAAVLGLVVVLGIVSNDGLAAFEPAQLQQQVMLFLNAFDYGWTFSLVFFGIHLFVLGCLVFTSGYAPKLLGILLIVSSFGYLIDSFAKLLLLNYASYESTFMIIVAVPGLVAELSFCFWLLFKGGKNQSRAFAGSVQLIS